MRDQYDCILFDVDETLFDFDAFQGLRLMLSRLGVSFTEHDFHEYAMLNKSLWRAYQLGQADMTTVKEKRFALWSERLNIPAATLNSHFIASMADLCQPLHGALPLLDKLKGNVKLGIITNGFTELLHVRLARAGLSEHFDTLVVSEEVGMAKPDRAIFDHALSLLGDPARDRVLMVGDTLESDILGGLNAGVQTCWLSPQAKTPPQHITPHFQVTSLAALDQLLHP